MKQSISKTGRAGQRKKQGLKKKIPRGSTFHVATFFKKKRMEIHGFIFY